MFPELYKVSFKGPEQLFYMTTVFQITSFKIWISELATIMQLLKSSLEIFIFFRLKSKVWKLSSRQVKELPTKNSTEVFRFIELGESRLNSRFL